MRLVRSTVDLDAELATLPVDLNYAHVGATRGVLPDGWRHVDRTWALPSGSFDVASEYVLSLGVLRGAGLRVATGPIEGGSPVLQALPLGPLVALVPCRVVYVVDEANERGFAYGTVPGHPERGEEAFLVRHVGTATTFTVRSFTRPGSRPVALGWPVAGLVVKVAVSRYGAAVKRACREQLPDEQISIVQSTTD
jgi:uncharacterized protein (UPF0548 family)